MNMFLPNSEETCVNPKPRKTNKLSIDDRAALEKVLGFTVNSNVCLAQSCAGQLAYLAGCTIVIYDPGTKRQEFIVSHAKKALTAVAFSCDGKLLATGESGHDPKLRIWDVRDKCQLVEFGGHKFSIQCVGFLYNPDLTLAVSIGSMHDMDVNVWNVRAKLKASSNKIAQKVKGIAFAGNGEYFVTVGNRHVKFWYLTLSTTFLNETVPLRGRAALLGDKKTSNFIDVVCGQHNYALYTYTLTTNGHLYELNESRVISRAVDLQVDKTFSIRADHEFLFIGCSNGITMIYLKKTLEFFAMLPLPHFLGVDVSKGLTTSFITDTCNNPDLKYADCIALCYDKHNTILTTFYNDHSFYVWDLTDLNHIRKLDSHLFHSTTCWSIDLFAASFNYDNAAYFKNNPAMPIESIISCGADNTIRIWTPLFIKEKSLKESKHLKRNIYSKELLKIIYLDEDISALCETDAILDTYDQTSKPPDQTSRRLSITETTVDTSKTGPRSLKISPHGDHLATGDRLGVVRVYDLLTLQCMYLNEVHQGDILDLDYSMDQLRLVSSGRDRTIKVFSLLNGAYELVQTLDDHSAAITAIKFCFNQIEQQLYLISCGFDKSLMFRTELFGNQMTGLKSSSTASIGFSTAVTKRSANNTSETGKQFLRTSYVVEKQSFYDLNIEPNNNFVYTISQDRMVRVYSVKDGKKVKNFKGSLNEDGYLVKLAIDQNGNFLATSCSDKCVYIWDLNSNECIAQIYGHSEIVTDLKFTADNAHLITVGDGCIFFWNLSRIYTSCSSSQIQYRTSNTPSPVPLSSHQASFKPPVPKQITVKPKPKRENSTCNQTNNRLMTQSRSYTTNINTALTQIETNRTTIEFRSMNTSGSAFQLNTNTDEFAEVFGDFGTKSTYSLVQQNESTECQKYEIKPRACWGPGINTQFAIMTDSRNQSAVDLSHSKKAKSTKRKDVNKRMQSANTLLNDALHQNKRVNKHKCTIL